MNKILVISGSTASGKSYLAEKLLEKYKNIIVLNADSMQVYKDLPILSAQPKLAMTDGYGLYGFLNFYENCSAGIWLKEADKLIKESFKLEIQPIIVGGTGLYLKALLDGIIEIPDVSNDVKEQVQNQFATLGKEKFYELLSNIDPISTTKIHKNDSYRMQRAMEIYNQTGQSITSFQSHGPNYEAIHISIDPTRNTLYKNCDLRFKEMLEEGATREVRVLLEKITTSPGKYNIENTLGYRSIVSHLSGQLSLEEAILEANQATRNYAKRQCTWFKNQFKDKILLQYEEIVTEVEPRFLEIVAREFKLLI